MRFLGELYILLSARQYNNTVNEFKKFVTIQKALYYWLYFTLVSASSLKISLFTLFSFQSHLILLNSNIKVF